MQKIIITIPVLGNKQPIEKQITLFEIPLPGEKIYFQKEMYVVYERIFIIDESTVIISLILKFAL